MRDNDATPMTIWCNDEETAFLIEEAKIEFGLEHKSEVVKRSLQIALKHADDGMCD